MKTKRNNSHRTERVAILINMAIMKVLRRGKMMDPRLIGCPITITKIEVSGDLQIAKCYFVPFNTNLNKDDILSGLEASKYSIRGFVTDELKLRYSPDIRFFYDHSFENASAILDKINNL
jgi:ribosome-binding factor A